MSQQLVIAYILFASAAAFTPGPNNVMLMTSGLNYGFQRSLAHLAGVTIGYSVMLGLVGLGLGAVFTAYPILQTILKYVGAVYLTWLAYVIATSKPADAQSAAEGKPMTFTGAALFQLVNVKGWVIAVGSVSAYAAIASYPWNMIVLAAIVCIITLGSSLTWLLFGTALQSLVKSPRAIRIFNITMAVLLLASLYPVLVEP
ncbi:MAG: LysE family translocator [Pseudomonadota bacterium]